MKIVFLNCCSLRSQSKHNQLAVLLSTYDVDVVLGCESHIHHSFLLSEILPTNYKVIRKDRCLGGGGVFIRYKDHLNICEESSLMLDAEIVWAKLYNSSNKTIYLCSFYRPPDNNVYPITQLSESLSLSTLVLDSRDRHEKYGFLKKRV